MMSEGQDRFWSKVKKTGACWLWTASTRTGYGQFHLADGTKVSAHRVAYEMSCGPIPPGLCVLHSCDVPNCVNPSHLFLGTIADNNADMAAKRRHYQNRKIQCQHGHPFDAVNTKLESGRFRRCRECARVRSRESYARKHHSTAVAA